jgi:hypothetical protein
MVTRVGNTLKSSASVFKDRGFISISGLSDTFAAGLLLFKRMKTLLEIVIILSNRTTRKKQMGRAVKKYGRKTLFVDHHFFGGGCLCTVISVSDKYETFLSKVSVLCIPVPMLASFVSANLYPILVQFFLKNVKTTPSLSV